MPALLAFDTATEHMSIGLRVAEQVWVHEGIGGAQASAALIPAVMDLLRQAGIAFGELDAIAFGRGPGAFTGLRTACSVAQGLGFGAGRPVIALDTLMAVAQDAAGDEDRVVGVAMDARMNEIYAATYRRSGAGWEAVRPPTLASVDVVNEFWTVDSPDAVAGNAFGAFAELRAGAARRVADALPRAGALIALARWHHARGDLLDAAQALPLYLRDKVAQTTAEREAARRAKEVAA